MKGVARHAALVSALMFVGYLAVGRAVGNFYPFSTFEMYAAERPASASRIFARDAAGVHEVSDYARWRCDRALDLPMDPISCAKEWPFEYTPAQDREAAAWIAEHPGGGDGESISLIRRVWRLSDGSAVPPSADCQIAVCVVKR